MAITAESQKAFIEWMKNSEFAERVIIIENRPFILLDAAKDVVPFVQQLAKLINA